MMHNYTPSKKKSSLDVELGPLKIKQTKTGPGAKSSAYLCSMFAVKFLLFLGVTGLLILAYVVSLFERYRSLELNQSNTGTSPSKEEWTYRKF